MDNDKIIQKRKALLSLLLGILGIGTGPIFIRYVNLDGNIVSFYRFVFAFLVLSLILVIRKGGIKISVPHKMLFWVIVAGLSFALNILLWTIALQKAPIAIVTILDNTAPIWVGLGSIVFLKEKQSIKYWVGLLITFCGAIVLVQNGGIKYDHSMTVGVFLSIASGFVYAVYFLVSQELRKTIDTLTYIWLIVLIGMLFMIIANVFWGFSTLKIGFQEAVLISLMTLFSQVFGWLLINFSIGVLPASKVSTALLGQPIIATILAALIFREIPSAFQALGAVTCIVGIFLVQRSKAITNDEELS